MHRQIFMSMIRKQIYIEPYQNSVLKSLCNETGSSEAELIRQAISLHLSGQSDREPLDITVWETEKVFISQYQQRSVVTSQRDWQRDDLYER